jgi:hypothetical protein
VERLLASILENEKPEHIINGLSTAAKSLGCDPTYQPLYKVFVEVCKCS